MAVLRDLAIRPRFCRYYSYRSEVQCRRIISPNKDFCADHCLVVYGYEARKLNRYPDANNGNRFNCMGQLARILKGKFQAMIEEATSVESKEETLRLTDEVAASRIIAARALQVYEALLLQEGENAEKASPHLKDLAAKAARDSLSHIASIAEKAAKVHVLLQDRTNEVSTQFMESVAAILARSLEAHPTLRDQILLELGSLKMLSTDDKSIVITL